MMRPECVPTGPRLRLVVQIVKCKEETMVKRAVWLSLMAVFFGAQMVAQTAPKADTKAADVNVVNTPSVNVVNTPTVQLAGASTVQVSGTTNVHVQNDSTAPVIVQDVS